MIASTILQRNARPIRYETAPHLFTTGQIVRLKDGFGRQPQSAATYRITSTLPPKGDSPQYRIRNDHEHYERVATQDSLELMRISPADSSGGLIESTFGAGQVTEAPQLRSKRPNSDEAGRKPEAQEIGRMASNMSPDANETELERCALAISVWENEGGAQASSPPDGQFGRRVEMDRSWTIYHVFTGVPARVDGSPLTDLSGSAATDGMLSLNRRNIKRQKERNAQP